MRRILMGFMMLLALAGASGLAGIAAARQAKAEQAVATFAGGCFWCTESDFDHVPGVLKTISGYTGGTVRNPSYEQVSSGGTGHAEAVQVTYDPAKVSYARLLTYYWHSIDPTVRNAQFCDHGTQYRTAIFVSNEAERALAEASKKKVEAELKRPIYTEIDAAGPFYPAEDYHQDFYKKNPVKYKFYRWNCGRDQRLKQIWGDSKGDS
ncbi:MAG: peptide-methionine (S)-S-oxide reductase MsrA [Rhodopseudomonas sp.]|nr:peptide-methionine (S)-S-oxide reductase MsrA [Rhodopseudomonas sp.]